MLDRSIRAQYSHVHAFLFIFKMIIFIKKGKIERWCWLQVSNPRPPVYKTGALPTELSQQKCGNYIKRLV